MTAVTGLGGQPNQPSKAVYEFALAPTCSDGKAWSEEQYKAAERLTPDVSDSDKRKYQEFLLRLGTLIRDQFLAQDPKARGRNYILKEFPEHYHIRRKLKSKVEKDKKDQYDFFIYGHPTSDRSGNPRSYASPNEFFHHLIWLIGGSKDTRDCACKLCNKSAKHEPESLKKRISSVSVAAQGSPAVTATTSAAASPALQSAPMRRSASASSTTARASAAAPKTIVPPPVTAATQQRSVSASIPLPVASAPVNPTPASSVSVSATPTSSAAPVRGPPIPIPDDLVIFREGEVVWYKNNNAWRIGVVVKAVPKDASPQAQSQCLVKPLAHAALQVDTVMKPEFDMRPFLAFSVPPVNMKEVQGLRMSQIDWQKIQNQYAGEDPQKQEIVGLEASKMAVVEIDKSYSTFNSMPVNPADPGRQRIGGVFLGAERITVREAVRVRLAPSEINPTWIKGLPIVMVLNDIYIAADGLHFFGDIYRLEETANPSSSSTHGQLPPSMLREQEFRSEVKKRTGTRVEWVTIQQNQDKPETAIRGRFYETTKLMPILDPARYQAALSRGVVEDVQAYLNNRLDSVGPYLGRRQNRVETLSTSVPNGFVLDFGPGISEG